MCKHCHIFTEKGLYYCPETYDPFIYCPYCGELLTFPKADTASEETEPKEIKTIFDYIKTLEDGTDKWRQAFIEMDKYVRDGKDPNEHIEDIIKKVEKKFKK